jgi:hypothetical protein
MCSRCVFSQAFSTKRKEVVDFTFSFPSCNTKNQDSDKVCKFKAFLSLSFHSFTFVIKSVNVFLPLIINKPVMHRLMHLAFDKKTDQPIFDYNSWLQCSYYNIFRNQSVINVGKKVKKSTYQIVNVDYGCYNMNAKCKNPHSEQSKQAS